MGEDSDEGAEENEAGEPDDEEEDSKQKDGEDGNLEKKVKENEEDEEESEEDNLENKAKEQKLVTAKLAQMAEKNPSLYQKIMALIKELPSIIKLFYNHFTKKGKVDAKNRKILSKDQDTLYIALHGILEAYWDRTPYQEAAEAKGIDLLLLGYDYTKPIDEGAEEVKEKIIEAIEKTGAGRVKILGYSLGGKIAWYLSHDEEIKGVIEEIITVGSSLAEPDNALSKFIRWLGNYHPKNYDIIKELRYKGAPKNSTAVYGDEDYWLAPLSLGDRYYLVDNNIGVIVVEGGHIRIGQSKEVIDKIFN